MKLTTDAELYELNDFQYFHVLTLHLTSEVCEFLIHSFRGKVNLWLNGVALTSVRKLGKMSSLTLSPGVENTLTLQHGGSAQTWTLTTMLGKPLFCFFFS